MNQQKRIAIIVSHPIQHFCPQYSSFSKNNQVAIKVFFASALGHRKYYDSNFKQEVSWGNLYLDQFDHHFLNGEESVPVSRKLDAPSLDLELSLFNPDLLVLYGYYQRFQRRAYRWALRNGVKLAYISDSEMRQRKNPIKEFFKKIYIRNYFSKIHFFLSVGNANEEYYQSCGVAKEKIIRMHFPIDVQSYEGKYVLRESLRREIRQQYGIGEDELVLSVVGKLVLWKSQDHIIDAMVNLEQQSIYGHLFIIGSGEMQERWEQKASLLKRSKVHFTGFVSPEELPSYYAATDIYVHPAMIEPHSIAISESIYMGCSVILSDRCGSYGESDDVQEGKNGFIYLYANIHSLSLKIKQLWLDHGMRISFSKHSLLIAHEFQRIAHFDVLNNLIEQIDFDKND
jgi:glycosyltransferase involved in cell wall biosynthesis